MNDTYVLNLNERGAADRSLCGGKGANLGLLQQRNFPTPHGFCLTVQAGQDFMKANRIALHLPGYPPDTFTDYYDEIVAISKQRAHEINKGMIPPRILAQLSGAVDSLQAKNDKTFSLSARSSARSEDSSRHSFAGVHESYLNINSRQALEAAIKKCWASAFSVKAIMYRYTNGLLEDLAMGVVIQPMIQAEVSGVTFTRHPVKPSEETMVLNAAKGLGDKLMSGAMIPDEYEVSRKDYKLLSVRLSNQTYEHSSRNGEPVKDTILSLEQLREICQISIEIEQVFGGQPQDVEWCLSAEKFYILQTRPITTI